MPVDQNGFWYPAVCAKQREIMEACLPGSRNMVLVSGPRLSGKTVGCQEAFVQHAWNTDHGNMCLLTITQSAGTDSGPWEHLTTKYIPEWIGDPVTGEGGNFGMEWVRKPFIANNSKKPTCVVSNRFGNETKISLESLKVEGEVEDKFKGKEYSCIWVNELSKFENRKTFDTLKLCFRGRPANDCLFLGDTNPADAGSSSWIYKLWYELPNCETLDDILKLFPDIEDPKILLPLRNSLRLIEVGIDDNVYLSQEQKDNLLASLAHDHDLVARYWRGEWVTASTDALFYEQFRPKFHVIPEDPNPPSDPDPVLLMPEEGCRALGVGMDPGDSVNSAAVIYEKVLKVVERTPLADGTVKEITKPIIKFLDEVVVVGKSHDLQEFTWALIWRMCWWMNVLEVPPKHVAWTYWSDRSVFERRQSGDSERFLAQLIYEASTLAIQRGEVEITNPALKRGLKSRLIVPVTLASPIVLQAAGRGPGTLSGRIDLWKRMLFEGRSFFSRDLCPKLIEANRSLRKPATGSALIQKGSIHKHPWDAASYALSEECYDEMHKAVVQEVRRERRKRNTLVSIGF